MVLRRSFPGQAGFEDVVFSESSRVITWPKAVAYGAENGGVLQSALEAMVYRMWSMNDDRSDQTQATRTAAVYFKARGVWHVAFDDSPDPTQNILVAQAEAGYRAHYDSYTVAAQKSVATQLADEATGKAVFVPLMSKWILSKTDPCIEALLQRARKDDRIIRLSAPEGRQGTDGGWNSMPALVRWDEDAGWYRPVENSLLYAVLGDIAPNAAMHLSTPAYVFRRDSLLRDNPFLNEVLSKPWIAKDTHLTVLPRDYLEHFDLGNHNVAIVPVTIADSVVDCTTTGGVHHFIGGGVARGVQNARPFVEYQR